MTGFTAGPWEAIAPDADSPCKVVVCRDARFHDSTRTICIVQQIDVPHRRHDEPDHEETDAEEQANTFLIAAAPDMFEVLKQVQTAITDNPMLWDIPIAVEDRLRKALFKAAGDSVKGEQP